MNSPPHWFRCINVMELAVTYMYVYPVHIRHVCFEEGTDKVYKDIKSVEMLANR